MSPEYLHIYNIYNIYNIYISTYLQCLLNIYNIYISTISTQGHADLGDLLQLLRRDGGTEEYIEQLIPTAQVQISIISTVSIIYLQYLSHRAARDQDQDQAVRAVWGGQELAGGQP